MLSRPFSIRPAKILENEPEWLIDFSITTIEIYSVLYMEKRQNDETVTLVEAYRRRWLSNSSKDSQGVYWLLTSKAIRQNIAHWAREHNLYIKISPTEIDFVGSTKIK